MLVGTSPAFDLAMFTTCVLSRRAAGGGTTDYVCKIKGLGLGESDVRSSRTHGIKGRHSLSKKCLIDERLPSCITAQDLSGTLKSHFYIKSFITCNSCEKKPILQKDFSIYKFVSFVMMDVIPHLQNTGTTELFLSTLD